MGNTGHCLYRCYIHGNANINQHTKNVYHAFAIVVEILIPHNPNQDFIKKNILCKLQKDWVITNEDFYSGKTIDIYFDIDVL